MTLVQPDPTALRSAEPRATSDPASPAPAAASPAGPSQRRWWRRSLLLSAGVHGLLVVSAFGLYRVHLGRSGETGPSSTVRLERSVNAALLPEERPEPERAAEVPPPSAEPELVESVVLPEPWPEDPQPEDVPLDDPLAGVPAFKGPAAPAAVAAAEFAEPVEPTEPREVVEATSPPATAPVAASAPRVLTGDDLPDVVEGPLPRYPRQALRMAWQGTVRLRIRVDAAGEVLDVSVTESSGHDVLDEAAVEAFERWVFAPKRASDPDVRVLGKPFTFRIR